MGRLAHGCAALPGMPALGSPLAAPLLRGDHAPEASVNIERRIGARRPCCLEMAQELVVRRRRVSLVAQHVAQGDDARVWGLGGRKLGLDALGGHLTPRRTPRCCALPSEEQEQPYRCGEQCCGERERRNLQMIGPHEPERHEGVEA